MEVFCSSKVPLVEEAGDSSVTRLKSQGSSLPRIEEHRWVEPGANEDRPPQLADGCHFQIVDMVDRGSGVEEWKDEAPVVGVCEIDPEGGGGDRPKRNHAHLHTSCMSQ